MLGKRCQTQGLMLKKNDMFVEVTHLFSNIKILCEGLNV